MASAFNEHTALKYIQFEDIYRRGARELAGFIPKTDFPLLDLCCGTGFSTRELAERRLEGTSPIDAVDSSSAQLAIARALFGLDVLGDDADQRLHDVSSQYSMFGDIAFYEHDVRNLLTLFEERRFSGAICNQGLHWVLSDEEKKQHGIVEDNAAAFFSSLSDVVRKDGIVVLNSSGAQVRFEGQALPYGTRMRDAHFVSHPLFLAYQDILSGMIAKEFHVTEESVPDIMRDMMAVEDITVLLEDHFFEPVFPKDNKVHYQIEQRSAEDFDRIVLGAYSMRDFNSSARMQIPDDEKERLVQRAYETAKSCMPDILKTRPAYEIMPIWVYRNTV